MRLFRIYGVIVAMALLAGLTLSGCGQGAKADSPYQGSYRATYSIPALGETGTFSYTVEQKGGMVGSFEDTNSGKIYAFNGSIESSGKFGGTTIDGANRFPTSGTFSSGRQTSAGGDFQQERNGVKFQGNFVITGGTIVAPGDNTYRGAYNGSYTLANGSQTGPVSFSVDQRGNVTGSFVNGSEVGQLTGTVNNAGTLNTTVTFPTGAAATLSGTLIRGAEGAPAGNFTLTRAGTSQPGAFSAPPPLPTGNSFVGAYLGSFSLPSLGQSGPVNYTVNPQGNIIGSFTRTSNGSQSGGETGIFRGVVISDGTLTGTVEYPSGTVNLTGTLVANSGSEPRGNFIQTSGTTAAAGTFSRSIDTPGANGFQGAYRGTYAIPERSESGNISFTINPTGDLIGFISQTNNTPVGAISGRVEPNGAFDCTVTYPGIQADPYRVGRPFKGRIAQTTVAGNQGLAGDFVMTLTTNSTTNTREEVAGNFELSIGGSEPNSNFRGNYGGGIQSVTILVQVGSTGTTETRILPGIPAISYALATPPNLIPSPTNRASETDFTVDVQGEFIGIWGGYVVRGRMTNDGRFVGTMKDATGADFPMVGKISKQGVPFKYDTGGELIFSAGVSGNFTVTVNGVEYVGAFFGAGGFVN